MSGVDDLAAKIREYIHVGFATSNREPFDALTQLADLARGYEQIQAERDEWQRREWLSRNQSPSRGACLWRPVADHFAEWDYAAAKARSCPHWKFEAEGDSHCDLPNEEYEACWGRAADHYMAAHKAVTEGA